MILPSLVSQLIYCFASTRMHDGCRSQIERFYIELSQMRKHAPGGFSYHENTPHVLGIPGKIAFFVEGLLEKAGL